MTTATTRDRKPSGRRRQIRRYIPDSVALAAIEALAATRGGAGFTVEEAEQVGKWAWAATVEYTSWKMVQDRQLYVDYEPGKGVVLFPPERLPEQRARHEVRAVADEVEHVLREPALP